MPHVSTHTIGTADTTRFDHQSLYDISPDIFLIVTRSVNHNRLLYEICHDDTSSTGMYWLDVTTNDQDRSTGQLTLQVAAVTPVENKLYGIARQKKEGKHWETFHFVKASDKLRFKLMHDGIRYITVLHLKSSVDNKISSYRVTGVHINLDILGMPISASIYGFLRKSNTKPVQCTLLSTVVLI